jgi:hypothetical protein
MANLSSAWRSPELSPQNIDNFEVKDGFIYFTCANYAGWYNATSFQKIGLIVIQDTFFGIPAFSMLRVIKLHAKPFSYNMKQIHYRVTTKNQ